MCITNNPACSLLSDYYSLPQFEQFYFPSFFARGKRGKARMSEKVSPRFFTNLRVRQATYTQIRLWHKKTFFVCVLRGKKRQKLVLLLPALERKHCSIYCAMLCVQMSMLRLISGYYSPEKRRENG